MIAEDKVLAPVEPLQYRFDRRRPEEQVAENVYRVVRHDLGVPFCGHRLVHLAKRSERPTAQTDDIEMPKMLVRGEVGHSEAAISNLFMLSTIPLVAVTGSTSIHAQAGFDKPFI